MQVTITMIVGMTDHAMPMASSGLTRNLPISCSHFTLCQHPCYLVPLLTSFCTPWPNTQLVCAPTSLPLSPHWGWTASRSCWPLTPTSSLPFPSVPVPTGVSGPELWLQVLAAPWLWITHHNLCMTVLQAKSTTESTDLPHHTMFLTFLIYIQHVCNCCPYHVIDTTFLTNTIAYTIWPTLHSWPTSCDQHHIPN